MKFPNHILLDVSKPIISNSSQYWIFKYTNFFKKSSSQNFSTLLLSNDFSFHKKFFFKKENLFLNNLMTNQKHFTLKYSYSDESLFLSSFQKNFFKKIYQPRPKVKHRVLENFTNNNRIYYNLTNDQLYDNLAIKRLVKLAPLSSPTHTSFKLNLLWTLFDINFLRKERIYTKLKYSRVPQYDIVSGGAAALFAGFLGFLISEKFGFELVDSGDFYFLFMYLVFLFFFIRPFLKITDANQSEWNALSLKWLINFYRIIFILLIKIIKSLFKKF